MINAEMTRPNEENRNKENSHYKNVWLQKAQKKQKCAGSKRQKVNI